MGSCDGTEDSSIGGEAMRGGGAMRRAVATSLESEQGHSIWLHVYDLGHLSGQLNEYVLRGVNLGAFHCGVEVLGEEWSFQGFHDAWDDPTLTGMVRNDPRQHPEFIYRESINMGKTELEEKAIDMILDDLMEKWPANGYHIVTRNCVTFAEEFCNILMVPKPFPAWVRGAIDAGKSPAVFAVADYAWSAFKWWCQRSAEQEAAEADAALEAARASALAVEEAATAASSGEGGEGLPQHEQQQLLQQPGSAFGA